MKPRKASTRRVLRDPEGQNEPVAGSSLGGAHVRTPHMGARRIDAANAKKAGDSERSLDRDGEKAL
jgi:hypothetical protein